MQFQVLFSRRDPDALVIDGILHTSDEPGRPVTIVGARTATGVLGLIIPATLDAWADRTAVVDVRDTGHSLVLSDGQTRVSLHPVDANA